MSACILLAVFLAQHLFSLIRGHDGCATCRFPSFVSCTTIDWFSVWPADALKSVAKKFLPQLGPADEESVPSGGPGSALRCAVEDTCMLFHTSIRKLAEDYRRWAEA